jgi:Nitrile hydratase beta subunit
MHCRGQVIDSAFWLIQRASRATLSSNSLSPLKSAGLQLKCDERSISMGEVERKTLLRQNAGGRAVHDLGGLEFGPIDREEHDLALWEKRTDALLVLLVGPKKGAFKIDALRRAIEDYGQQAYDHTSYYEKWIRAIRNLLVEQEVLSRAEVEAKIAEVRSRHVKLGRTVSSDAIPW